MSFPDQLRAEAARLRTGNVYLPHVANLLEKAAAAIDGTPPPRPQCLPGCRTVSGKVNHAFCATCRKEMASPRPECRCAVGFSCDICMSSGAPR